MKATVTIFLFLLLFLSPDTITASPARGRILIKGRVTDNSGSAVPKAIILVDGNSTNSFTDAQGNYRIKVRPDALSIGIMTFSMGYREEMIAGRKHIDFRFSSLSGHLSPGSDDQPGDKVVDLGYSSVRRRDLTNSVGVFDFKNPKKVYTSVKDMILEIPGIKSKVFNMYGPVGPTIVVDGVVNYNIDLIQPSMVESIVFLRDGSAAIYGSRGFGGVILIRTKSTMIDD